VSRTHSSEEKESKQTRTQKPVVSFSADEHKMQELEFFYANANGRKMSNWFSTTPQNHIMTKLVNLLLHLRYKSTENIDKS
jgi:hypothetical protein